MGRFLRSSRYPRSAGLKRNSPNVILELRVLYIATSMQARIVFALFAAGCTFAQAPSFPTPSYFRQTFAPVNSRVELQGPVRLRDFVADGKLELSLKQYLELVMANNTDIQIQLLSLEMPKNAITRAFSTWDPLAAASFTNTKSSTPST